MSEGLAGVQARITEIRSLVDHVTGARAPGQSSATAAGTTRSSFEEVLTRAGATATSAVIGERVVQAAKKYLGVNYRWGGTDPRTGLDCSGLTQLVYGEVGVDLPRTSAQQARTGTAVSSLAAARPGDLVFFGSPVHHVGIYLGDGKMLDAPHRGEKVQIRKVYETPSAIRRVLPGTADLAGPGVAAARSSTGDLSASPYSSLFVSAGRRYGLDPALLSAVAKVESGYRPDAVSPAGARGLMQIMPATARALGVNPDVPAQAVDGAARLLADNLRTFNGRMDLALAAYNAGPGAVRKYGGVPPYPETRNYVQLVTKNWGELR